MSIRSRDREGAQESEISTQGPIQIVLDHLQTTLVYQFTKIYPTQRSHHDGSRCIHHSPPSSNAVYIGQKLQFSAPQKVHLTGKEIKAEALKQPILQLCQIQPHVHVSNAGFFLPLLLSIP